MVSRQDISGMFRTVPPMSLLEVGEVLVERHFRVGRELQQLEAQGPFDNLNWFPEILGAYFRWKGTICYLRNGVLEEIFQEQKSSRGNSGHNQKAIF